MEAEGLRDKFAGALLGTAVGDALGMPFEGLSSEEILRNFGEPREMLPGRLPAGSYTDDTEMMIALAESLIERRGLDPEHAAAKFAEKFEPRRGYGPGSTYVISRMKAGASWKDASRELFGGSGSYGNGGAMRIAPIGAFYYDDEANLIWAAKASSAITHSHELGMEGAAMQAMAVATAVRLSPSEPLDVEGFLSKLAKVCESEIYRRKLSAMAKLLSGSPSRSEVISELGNGVEAFNSVPTAIYCFLRSPRDFESAVSYAVSLGGDCDTIGAMAGAIAGAYLGARAIPRGWLSKLENADAIRALAEELLNVKLGIRSIAR